MADKKKATVNYRMLQDELETVLTELQRDDVDIDQALKHYERGLEIVQQLERYLVKTEHRIVELKAHLSSET